MDTKIVLDTPEGVFETMEKYNHLFLCSDLDSSVWLENDGFVHISYDMQRYKFEVPEEKMAVLAGDPSPMGLLGLIRCMPKEATMAQLTAALFYRYYLNASRYSQPGHPIIYRNVLFTPFKDSDGIRTYISCCGLLGIPMQYDNCPTYEIAFFTSDPESEWAKKFGVEDAE